MLKSSKKMFNCFPLIYFPLSPPPFSLSPSVLPPTPRQCHKILWHFRCDSFFEISLRLSHASEGFLGAIESPADSSKCLKQLNGYWRCNSETILYVGISCLILTTIIFNSGNMIRDFEFFLTLNCFIFLKSRWAFSSIIYIMPTWQKKCILLPAVKKC